MKISNRDELEKVQIIGMLITDDILNRKTVMSIDGFLNCIIKFAKI